MYHIKSDAMSYIMVHTSISGVENLISAKAHLKFITSFVGHIKLSI